MQGELVLTELLFPSEDCSMAFTLCWPIGDNCENDDRVGSVGTAFVVKRRVKLARSAFEEEECEANWLLEVRIGDA